MLRPIKSFYAEHVPSIEDWEDAIKLAKDDEVIYVDFHNNLKKIVKERLNNNLILLVKIL